MTAIQNGDRYTGVAGADLTGKLYHVVKLDTNGQVVLAAAATDNILGVLEVDGVKGEAVSVALANGVGSFKVKLTANTSKDAFLTTDANGKAVATTTAGNRVFGRLVKAGVAGEVAEYIKHNEKY